MKLGFTTQIKPKLYKLLSTKCKISKRYSSNLGFTNRAIM